ncbi:MAG: alpha/beta fold hydrolase [Bacteroidota bacterium]|nr:alpha/beta fold hydrolase [Candidatus Kapabacteria bacterium]MCX7936668.1 alpha/beta fold hydrolase [Chlorobiota bacterium]MDW8272183.1 alpha/beta fold hydrolase [Bacteroidota bacterium]
MSFPPDGTLLAAQPVPMPASTRSIMRRRLSAEEFARYEQVQMYAITYVSEGLRICGYLAVPPAGPQPYPAIIFNRGGAGPRAALQPEGAFQYIAPLASWGYVVAASNYRGQGGSEGIEQWGDGDVRDALNLLPLLHQLGYVDTDRIGLVGGSRGGMMAFMMLRRTDVFRAAVTIGAPTMLHRCSPHSHIRRTFNRFLDPQRDIEQQLRERSVLVWANELPRTTPLLILHGTGDRRVEPEQSLHLALELQRLQMPYKLIMYDNADHILAGRRAESDRDIRWWLDHYVYNRAPLPKTGPHGA